MVCPLVVAAPSSFVRFRSRETTMKTIFKRVRGAIGNALVVVQYFPEVYGRNAEVFRLSNLSACGQS
jgi:hypothetical protein